MLPYRSLVNTLKVRPPDQLKTLANLKCKQKQPLQVDKHVHHKTLCLDSTLRASAGVFDAVRPTYHPLSRL